MKTSIAHSEPLRGAAPYIRGMFTAILLALAMPGITGWWPLLFIALLPLFSALGRLSTKQALYMGLFSGILYYINLSYWIVPVLQRFGGLHVATASLALLLLATYMAIYLTLFCLLLNKLLARARSRGNAATLLLLTAPILWTGLDFLRGTLFTGLPWMDLGYALYQQPLLIQAADLGGHHLITFSVVMVNTLLFWLLDRMLAARSSALPVSGYHFGHPITVFLLLSCLGGYSVLRYQQIASDTATADTVMVSAVQGNIEQHLKWSPTQKEKTVDRYLSLSLQALGQEEKPELLVWPETALPFYPTREPLMNKIRAFQRKNEVRILTGSPFFIVNPKDQTRVFYFNSALLLNQSGRLTARYNKQHLVPFGEYVPLRTYLWFLKPIVELIGDFTPGNSFAPLKAEKIQAGILICFESIFPDIARKESLEGANLLVSMTNDAWYGKSSAPYHSWAMTVFRAVENRRGLVRAANTGISGFVSPIGEIAKESSLFTAQTISLKTPLLTGHTIFMLGGYRFGLVCCILIPILLYLSTRRQQNDHMAEHMHNK